MLLLDIKMPEMNGFELYREIKNIMKVNDNVKVCFITTYEVYYEQLKEEFSKIDIACFIKRPIVAKYEQRITRLEEDYI
jgi:response regulator RpfG family c-di-GMP phosphodiesterase